MRTNNLELIRENGLFQLLSIKKKSFRIERTDTVQVKS